VNKFHDAVMTISNKVDIKGFALVAWDEKGTPCIAWDTGHNKNIIFRINASYLYTVLFSRYSG
jgi:hypothetical protein